MTLPWIGLSPNRSIAFEGALPIALRVISTVQKPLVFEVTSHGVRWVLSKVSAIGRLPGSKVR